VDAALVCADPEGRRRGCIPPPYLIEILNHGRARRGTDPRAPDALERDSDELCILIVHARGELAKRQGCAGAGRASASASYR
jgi:hypothetical protein